ncbi:FG-GAP-like repeat-containing protein [Streptomyces apocyni]|uniref:FG-GAP-like repeat-containing protein n=1 Tax=Streptomyces apocyni TaxID=2654677 RepID=UPI0012E9E773|nr:FG-GAP-like repeat-containing protein [Streptomyces apocyni]
MKETHRRPHGGARRRARFLGATLALAVSAPLVSVLPTTPAAADSRDLVAEHTPEEARALAQAAKDGKPVEVLSQRTENAQVFANPEGDFTQDTYATAQWVRKGNKLIDIDPTLAKNADGDYATRATEVGVTFSGGGKGPLATVQREGRSLSLAWPGVLPKPTVADDTVTYPEVLDGVDLKLKAHSGGYNQVLVIKNAKAAKNPKLAQLDFGLDTTGLEAKADEHGNIRALNPAGQEVFTAPTPLMWDSSEPDTPAPARTLAAAPAGPPAVGASARMPPTGDFEPGLGAKDAAMGVKLGKKSLALTPNKKLLTGKDTQYPVYLDPSVEGSRHSWAIVYKKYPNTSYFNGAGFNGGTSTARAGYENVTNGLARSYFRMNTKNLRNKDRVISKSTFRIKNSWSWSCSSRKIELWHTSYLKSSHTWNNQPAKKSTLATVSDAKGYNSSCPAGNLAFSTTSAAKQSQAGSWNTLTFALKATSESDVYSWKKFDAKSAVLSTTYNTRPSAPTSLDTIPSTKNTKGCGDVAPYGLIGNTDIYLTAKAKDADGGKVNVKFHLWPTGHHNSGNGIIVNKTVAVTSGTVAKLKVTKATLSPHVSTAGGNFSWKAQANDGSLYSDWTPTKGAPGCRFVYDPNRPSTPPGVTSSQFPDGSDGWPYNTSSVRTEGTFTLTSGGVDDVTKYEYWSDWDSTRRTATPGSAGGSVSVKLTPTVTGSNQLYVKSYDKVGNSSDTNVYLFYANGPKTPDKPGDINGDGNADLWAVDKDGTLRRFYGAGDGTVAEASTTASGWTWNNAKITHRGDWNGNGYEDLVSLRPDATSGTNRLWIHPNTGYGFACSNCNSGPTRQELTVYDPNNKHWEDGAKQILAIGDVDGGLDTNGDGTEDIPGYPDLVVNDGEFIWLYYGNPDYSLDAYREPVLLAGPDDPIASGGSTVNEVTLAAPGDFNGDGRPDLVVRYDRPDVGGLHVFYGKEDDATGAYDISLTDRIGVDYNWSTSTVPLFTAAPDANNDGKFDLWATTADSGRLRFFPDYTADGHSPVTIASEAFTGYQSIG